MAHRVGSDGDCVGQHSGTNTPRSEAEVPTSDLGSIYRSSNVETLQACILFLKSPEAFRSDY